MMKNSNRKKKKFHQTYRQAGECLIYNLLLYLCLLIYYM